MFFWIFILFLICQRLVELVIAKRNEKKMLARGAVEYDRAGYKWIVAMHTMFFISLITEKLYFDRGLISIWVILLAVFIIMQICRYWVITSLGEYWNTRIIVLNHVPLIKEGPYKFLKHPNYTIVFIEIAVIPLIFSCYFTGIIFTILNLILLKRRIRIENDALGIK